MATYEATIDSRWPAREAFGYLSVFSNASDWDPGVLAADQLDPGPVRIGTRFALLVPFLGRRLRLTYTVTDLDHGRAITLLAVSGPLRAQDRITVTAAGSQSVVGYQATVTLRGPLAALNPLLAPGFRRVGDRAAAGLAAALTGPVRAAGQDPARSPAAS